MSLDQMSIKSGQSPKTVARHIHRSIRKLESWSINTIPVQSYHSPSEQGLGILNPWQAEHRITRIIREIGNLWACIVVLAMPNGNSGKTSTSLETISCHILNCVRHSDIVTKWSTAEWIIFLPHISREHTDMVAERLNRNHFASWTLSVLACLATPGESFSQLAVRGHNELLQQYINRDLGSWEIP